MRVSKLCLTTIVTTCVMLCGSFAYAMTPAQWHAASQPQRNAWILQWAYQDNGYVGLNCKQWPQQRVVPQASGGAVSVPPTAPDANGWYWAPAPYVVQVPLPYQIAWAQPGWIVQMRIVGTKGVVIPHTAIVANVAITGYNSQTGAAIGTVTFIDSNWYNDNTVRVHSMSFAQFNASLESQHFTLYYFQ